MPISTQNGLYYYKGIPYTNLQDAKKAEMADSSMTIDTSIPAPAGIPTRQPMPDALKAIGDEYTKGIPSMGIQRPNVQPPMAPKGLMEGLNVGGRGSYAGPATPASPISGINLAQPTPNQPQAPKPERSFMDKLTSTEGLGSIGALMLSMSNNPNLQKIGMAEMQNMDAKRTSNRTLEFLKTKGVDDETLEALKNNPQMINAYASSLLKTPKSYAAQENYKLAKAQGYKGSFIDYQKEMALAGAGVELGAGKDYLKDANKYLVERLGGMMDNMDSARSKQIQLQTLDKLLSESPTGFAGAAKNWLGNFGIETEGLDNIQAANAIINQLVPQQRPAGSGPMSDKDLEMFKASLPRLINTPEGNRKIMETLKMINNYEMEIGRIAESAMYGELTPQEARERMKSLENPLGWVRGDSGSSAEQQQWVRDPETGKLVLKSG